MRADELQASLYTGAGNRFVLLEVQAKEDRVESDGDAALCAFTREICSQELFDGQRPDGCLLVSSDPQAAARMILFNADGTRPEACGNGLRCVGWHLARTRGLERVEIVTDAGVRAVRMEESEKERAYLSAEMGCAEFLGELNGPLPDVEFQAAQRFNLGNPHCVLLVDDERRAPLERVGNALQGHPDFPQGVNVGFLARREGSWRLRVWERGVGETEACGTAACAAAAFLGRRDGEQEHELHLTGGLLWVGGAFSEPLELRGWASYHGELKIEAPGEILQLSAWAT